MQLLNDGINNLWATPVYKTSIDGDLCNHLLTYLLQNVNLESFAKAQTNLFKLDDPVIEKFRIEVIKVFGEYFDMALHKNLHDYRASYKAWTTGQFGAWSMPTHNHAGSPFVSVFYISADEHDSGGEITINDPRTNANRGYTEDFQEPFRPLKHKPKTGDVLVFPGYLYHAVEPFTGTLRMAIPVDIFLDDRDDGDDC